MQTKDINPFLRFVEEINFLPMQSFCRAVDCHFYFVTEDVTSINIDGVRYNAEKGSVIIVPAGVPYYFIKSSHLGIISINFDYTMSNAHSIKEVTPVLAERFDEADITETPDFTDSGVLNNPIVTENMSYLRPLVDGLLEEYKYKKQFYRDVSSAKFKEILFEVLRAALYRDDSGETVNTVLTYIHDHFSEDIDNNTLSHIAGYHPYHLNRLIKKATGTTLRQYLIDYRIGKAKKYLTETDRSISEISEKCGYKNLCSFSSDFKNRIGVTPQKFRSKHKHFL